MTPLSLLRTWYVIALCYKTSILRLWKHINTFHTILFYGNHPGSGQTATGYVGAFHTILFYGNIPPPITITSSGDVTFHTILFYGNISVYQLLVQVGRSLSTQFCSTETWLDEKNSPYTREFFPHNSVLRKHFHANAFFCSEKLSTQFCSTETPFSISITPIIPSLSTQFCSTETRRWFRWVT